MVTKYSIVRDRRGKIRVKKHFGYIAEIATADNTKLSFGSVNEAERYIKKEIAEARLTERKQIEARKQKGVVHTVDSRIDPECLAKIKLRICHSGKLEDAPYWLEERRLFFWVPVIQTNPKKTKRFRHREAAMDYLNGIIKTLHAKEYNRRGAQILKVIDPRVFDQGEILDEAY